MTYLAYSEEEHHEPAYIVGGQACWTHEEACEVAGIETPAQLAAEEPMYFEEECVQEQDAMEARGGPYYFFPGAFFEECPF